MKKRILVLDVGGTNVKVLLSGQKVPTKIPSGPTLTPRAMVDAVKKLARGWKYDVVTIGFPAAVVRGKILAEPKNLARGWMRFDFQKAFGKPVKVLNDAAMQALGSYEGGTMAFLGLGTGLGSALVSEGVVIPMELAHLPYKKGEYEDYVGLRGFKKYGKRRWRKFVDDVVHRLRIGLVADYVVLGGGQTKQLKTLPKACRRGDNWNAFIGGQRIWDEPKKGSRQKRHGGFARSARPQDAREPVPAPGEVVAQPGS